MMKKIPAIVVSIFIVIISTAVGSLAAETKDFGKDFAVYLFGPDKNNNKPTFSFEGNTYVSGNAIIETGTFYPKRTDSPNIINGKIYPNTGVTVSSLLTSWQWGYNQILSQNIIAEQGTYSANVPENVTIKDFSKIASGTNKGDLNAYNTNVTINESGLYGDIVIGGNPNTLTIDTTGKSEISIVCNKLNVNGSIKIVGNGKVNINAKEIITGGKAFINATESSFGNSEQLTIYIMGSSKNISISGDFYLAGDVCITDSQVTLGGTFKTLGNWYFAKGFTSNTTLYMNGLIYAPDSDLVIAGSSEIKGAVVAKTLEVNGSARIIKGSYSDAAFFKEEEEPEPTPTDDHVNGLLGEYFDNEFLDNNALKIKRIDNDVQYNWMYGSPKEGIIEPETFSARWTGYIKVPATDYYTFRTYSDDGVRLYINNENVIDSWGLINLEYRSSDKIYLEAGTYYPIKLEYQQLPYNSTVFLFWESNSTGNGVIGSENYFIDKEISEEFATPKYYNTIAKNGQGLKCEFYNTLEDFNSNTPASTIENSDVNFDWGSEAPESITSDSFYAVMTGYVEAKYTEDTTFAFIIDDAAKLYINDVLVIDAWDKHSQAYIQSQFHTVAGQKYKIRIEYADLGGGATCILRWEGPSQKVQVVPKELLYTSL